MKKETKGENPLTNEYKPFIPTKKRLGCFRFILFFLVFSIIVISAWHLNTLAHISKNVLDVDFVTSVQTGLFGTKMVINISENDYIKNVDLLTSEFERFANIISHDRVDIYSIFFPYRVHIEMAGGLYTNNLKYYSSEFIDIFTDRDSFIIQKGPIDQFGTIADEQYIINDQPITWGKKNHALKLNYQEAKDLYIRGRVYGFKMTIKPVI